MIQDVLLHLLETEYLPKIYGYSLRMLKHVEKAQDLTQDIALAILFDIRAGKDIPHFNAYVYSVCHHMYCKQVRKSVRQQAFYLDEMLISPKADDDPLQDMLLEEERALLRREIAFLPQHYRHAVLMRYYYGASCEAIAKSLHRSVGTIKWWLSDARKRMKEGMETVREFGERSYQPDGLFVSCQGTPGANREPMSLCSRKSTQNILLTAYKQPVTVETLSTALGIPAAYIEDEVEILVKNELMRSVGTTYQTDFVILPGQDAESGTLLYEAVFPAFSEKLYAFLNENREVLTQAVYNGSDFSWERLLWMYVHFAVEYLLDGVRRKVGVLRYAEDIPERPNGGKWIAIGFEQPHHVSAQNWQDYHNYDGPVQKCTKDCVQGFFHHWSGADSSEFFDLPDGIFALCRRLLKRELTPETMTAEESYLFTTAFEKGLLIKDADGIRACYCLFTRAGLMQAEAVIDAFADTAAPYFEKAYRIITSRYEKTVPAHLHTQMHNFMTNWLNLFVTCTLYDGVRTGNLSFQEEDQTRYWLSIIAAE